MPDGAAHLDGSSVAALVSLPVIHAAIPKWLVQQFATIDRQPNALTAIIGARAFEQLSTHSELPNEVQFQVSIKVRDHVVSLVGPILVPKLHNTRPIACRLSANTLSLIQPELNDRGGAVAVVHVAGRTLSAPFHGDLTKDPGCAMCIEAVRRNSVKPSSNNGRLK